jgi:hypothetical protein
MVEERQNERKTTRMGGPSLSLATEALDAVLNPPVAVYKTHGRMINTKAGLKEKSRASIVDVTFAESFDMKDLLQAWKEMEESGDFPMIGWFDDDDDDKDDEESTTSDLSLISIPRSKRICGSMVRSKKRRLDLASLAGDSCSDIRDFSTSTLSQLPRSSSLTKISTMSSMNPFNSSLSKISAMPSFSPLSSLSELPPRPPPLYPKPISPARPHHQRTLCKSSLMPNHVACPLVLVDPPRLGFPVARVA